MKRKKKEKKKCLEKKKLINKNNKVTAIPILGEKASNSLSISWNPSSSSTGYQVGIVVNETSFVFFFFFFFI